MGGKSRARRRQRGGAGPEQRETGRAQRIARAVAEHDLTALKQLARTGDGLLTTQLRRQAWPLLLNFRSLADAGDRGAAHRDEDQVALDVRRTRLPDAPEIRRDVRARRLAELSQVVSGVLRSYPWLSYYQGFHELAMTFLCVFGSPRPAVEAAKMAALFFVRDAMGSSLDHVMQQLDLLYVLLEAACPRVHALLAALDVPPFFAISWVLTWFAHDVESFADVCRLFDHLIVSPPLQVVHVAAALIRLREAEVLACERDFAAVHTALAALPATTADWLPVIDGACALQA
ncbi:GTPase-activating protein gyp8, partial [Coemansia helicoidea]